MPFSSRRIFFLAAFALALPLGACGTLVRSPARMVDGTRIEALPPSPAAKAYGHYLSGNLAARQHNLRDAALYYRKALAHDPGNSEILAQAFTFTAAAGDVRVAAALAARLVAANPNNRGARLALAVNDIASGRYRDARKQLAESAKGPFQTLTLTLLDAWAAQGMGKTAAALKDLDSVAKEGGADAVAAYHRALILDLAGRNEAAGKAYLAALKASGPNPREVDAYGRFLERTGKPAEAKALYAALKGHPSIAPIAAEGDARIVAGKKPHRLVRNAKDGAAEALFGIAASLTDVSSAEYSIIYLQFGLYLAPHLDLAKVVLADRFEMLHKFEDAIAVYRTIAKDSVFGLAAEIQMAIDETRLGHAKRAIAHLKDVTVRDPKNVTAWTALGDAYRSVERFKEAADAYDHAIKSAGEAGKKSWQLYYARGVSEERAKNWPAAEADLQHALNLSPNQPDVLNYLGYSWVDRSENLTEALAMLEKARTLSPYNGYIVDSVGWAYFRLGRYKQAANLLERAVLLVPGDPTINEHLGDAYWKVGRKLEARFQWDHALAFNPEPDQKIELEKKLKFGLSSSSRP
jgi:tetratricopeptide (TPR) repeat protein